MERSISALLLLLIIAVLGLGFVVWQADRHAGEAADRQLCVAQANATATISLMAPSNAVDSEGRVAAIRTLGARLDKC